MAPRTYLNFDLLFEPEGKGQFRARVVDSPDGTHPFVDFTLPFDPLTLENLLLKLDPGRSGTRRGSAAPQVDAGRALGGALFDAVFTDGIAIAWARAKDTARARKAGVRLRLHLTDAPSIAGLPWELLHDGRFNTYLAQSERTPVVRYLDVAHSQPPLKVEGPLRVLVVVSAPTDLADLDVEAEWDHVKEALDPRVRSGLVTVDRLPAPTLGELGRLLRTGQVHVLHFIGHGDLDARSGDGVLYFCDEYGRSSPVSASVLGPYVLDHDPLRLLVLNACRSASTEATDPFGGMAQGLVQQQAAAVVAMQFPITDRAAAAFAREFYGALTDGFPVDQAVTSARKALWAGYGAEWATPTVFLHTGDGQIFDAISPAQELVPADATPASEPEATAQPAPVPAGPVPAGPAPAASAPAGRESLDAQALDAAARGEQAAEPEAVRELPLHLAALGPGPVPLDPQLPDEPGVAENLEDLEDPGVAYVFGHARPPHRRRMVLMGAGVTTAVVAAGLAYLNLPRGVPDEALPGGPGPVPTAPGPGASADNPVTDPATDEPTDDTAAEAVPPTVRAARLTARIDVGDAEWEGATRYFSDRRVAGPGEPAVRAEWRLGWDDDNYYVYVIVQDPTFTAAHLDDPPQLWQGDSVHFEFGATDPDRPADELDGRDRHVLIGPGGNGLVVVQYNVPDSARAVFDAGPRSTGARAGVWFGDGGYTVEAAIPWSELTGTAPAAGQRFVTNLNVSDAHSSGDLAGQFSSMWSNNLERSTNDASTRAGWGVVELAG